MGTFTKLAFAFGGGADRAELFTGGAGDSSVYNFANTDDFTIGFAVPQLLRDQEQVFCGKKDSEAGRGYEYRILNGQLFMTLTDLTAGEMTVRAGAVGEFTQGGFFVAFRWAGSVSNDASNASIVVDGVDLATSTISNDLVNTTASSTNFQVSGIGGSLNTTRPIRNGIIDWLFIYDAVLSIATIGNIFNSGDLIPVNEVQLANLLHFSPFDFRSYNHGTSPTLKNVISNGTSFAEIPDFSRSALKGTGFNIGAGAMPSGVGPGGVSTRVLEGQGAGTERFDFGDVLKRDTGDAWSISFWLFRPVAAASTYLVVSKRLGAPTFRGWSIAMQSTGTFSIFLANDNGSGNILSLATTAAFDDATWMNLVVTFDGTETAAGTNIYANGALAGKATITDALTGTYDNTVDFQISGGGGGTGLQLDSRVAEVQTYPYALPATAAAGIPSVADIFNGGVPKYPTAWFDATGLLAPDSYLRPGEEYNALRLFNSFLENTVNAGFGEIGGNGGDTTPPVITLVSPAGSEISLNSELVIRITDPTGLQRGAIFHTPAGGQTEMIYEGVGDGLRTGYLGTVVDITNGFEITVTRVGGWNPPLVFEVLAYDDSGNTTPA